ncbi:KRI1-like protein [Micractinium conductrix]|uniref:KRI1-like protein n=1 Tax=Micractinium conductrix TaxID=554055 RepID=A0A2P6VMS6_9CHLO|nr:KRI1-like protein [Micractinium conductrix]|eukprot:PSC75398.1 KRI1-like protein [Micractinium conductrix]
MAPPKPLFDDEEDVHQQAELRVNEQFARRFEHNKKREELQRLQEKYPEQAAKLSREHAKQAYKTAMAKAAVGPAKAALLKSAAAAEESQEESSSSDDEIDAEQLLSKKTQAQIFETMMKIRARDPAIYKPDTKFYSSSDDEGEDGGPKKAARKEKPMYLKDVMYQQALQEGGTDSDEEGGPPQPRTYAQEQDELKQAFLSAFDEGEAAGADADSFGAGVLKERKRRAKGRQQGGGNDGAEAAEEQEAGGGGGAAGRGGADAEDRVQQLLDGYFGRDEELSKEDRFLKKYILNKGWVEEGDEALEGDDDDDMHAGDELVDDAEDEQFVEQAEQFEHAYNFRFEEPGAAAIITYPRNMEGTVRKEDDRRKRKRQEKAERLAAEEEARRAELKRLKNLKKAEIEDKLHEIQSVAGKAAPRQELLDRLVTGDFDPEEYDRQMAAAFGSEYYDAGADEATDDDLEDELFEKELEAMAKYGSDDEDPKSFAALHKRLAAQRREEAAAGGEEDKEDEEDEEDEEDGAAADPEAAARARAEVQRLLEEYYKLDYEDVVGGVPTRFRYKEVQPDSFGLEVEDILALEDKELNSVVGLKRLAPYREEHKKFRPNYQKVNELKLQRQAEQGQGGRGAGGSAPFGPRQHRQGGRGGGGRSGERGDWKQQQEQQGGGKWRQQQGEQQHRGEAAPEKQQKSVAERRLESYERPTLKRGRPQQQGSAQPPQQQQPGQQQPGGGQKRKREAAGAGDGQRQQQQRQEKQAKQPQAQPASDGPQLSKTAKKNMKRAEKRAAKRPKVDASGGKAAA